MRAINKPCNVNDWARLSSLARIVKPPASLRRSFEPSSGPKPRTMCQLGTGSIIHHITMMLSIHINSNENSCLCLYKLSVP